MSAGTRGGGDLDAARTVIVLAGQLPRSCKAAPREPSPTPVLLYDETSPSKGLPEPTLEDEQMRMNVASFGWGQFWMW